MNLSVVGHLVTSGAVVTNSSTTRNSNMAKELSMPIIIDQELLAVILMSVGPPVPAYACLRRASGRPAVLYMQP